MRLEQQLLYELRFQERERVYHIVDLESLSASVLYGISGPLGGSGPLKQIPELKFFEETIRFDSHQPYGDHINYETWLKLKGSKKGRYLKLDNIHISLEDDE